MSHKNRRHCVRYTFSCKCVVLVYVYIRNCFKSRAARNFYCIVRTVTNLFANVVRCMQDNDNKFKVRNHVYMIKLILFFLQLVDVI